MQAEASPEQGRAVYHEVCMRCHASDPMTDRPGSAARIEDGVLRAIESIPQMRWLRQRLSAAQIADVQSWLDFVVLPATAIRPQTGWYWNPDEPGRGYFFEYAEGYASLAAYFYAEDGRADWALGSVRYDGRANPLTLPLQRFRDGQPLADPAWREPAPLPALPAQLDIRSARMLHLGFDLGSGPTLTRLAFDLGTAPRPPQPGMPQSGWWWNPETPGTGYALEVQGNDLFIAAYSYAEDGHATWLSAFGPLSPDLRFVGRWQSFAYGQTLLGPHRPARAALDGGPLQLRFSTPRTAHLILPDGREMSIQRYF